MSENVENVENVSADDSAELYYETLYAPTRTALVSRYSAALWGYRLRNEAAAHHLTLTPTEPTLF